MKISVGSIMAKLVNLFNNSSIVAVAMVERVAVAAVAAAAEATTGGSCSCGVWMVEAWRGDTLAVVTAAGTPAVTAGPAPT